MTLLSNANIVVKRIFKHILLCNVPKSVPRVLHIAPHDGRAFTQGLLVTNGSLYESTGLIGQSSIRKLSLDTSEPQIKVPLANHWGEGIACQGDELVQLTWKSRLAKVYSLPNLEFSREIQYQGEGWGLAKFNDGFVMTDGSENLKFLNSEFELVKTVQVLIKGRPLQWLNDLIYANGALYVNRLGDDNIYQICPNSAKVIKVYDCSDIVAQVKPLGVEDHLNGIAYDEEQQHFIITGKRWDKLFIVLL